MVDELPGMPLTLGNRRTLGQEALVPIGWALRPIAGPAVSVLAWIVVVGLAMSALALAAGALLGAVPNRSR